MAGNRTAVRPCSVMAVHGTREVRLALAPNYLALVAREGLCGFRHLEMGSLESCFTLDQGCRVGAYVALCLPATTTAPPGRISERPTRVPTATVISPFSPLVGWPVSSNSTNRICCSPCLTGRRWARRVRVRDSIAETSLSQSSSLVTPAAI